MKLLHEDAGPEAVEVFRVWVFGIWLFKVVTDPLAAIAGLPQTIFNPTGFLLKFLPASLKHFLLAESFLFGLKTVLILSLVFVIFKVFLRSSSVLACFFLTLYQGIIRSFGHVNHAEIELLYAAYFLTLFSIADGIFEKQGKHDRAEGMNLNSIPLISTLACLCFSYTFVGIYRVARAGLGIYSSDSLAFWILDNSLRTPESITPVGLLILKYPLLGEMLRLGFPAGTIFEILAPFTLLSRWFRYLFIAVMVPFHLIILLFMGINFWEQLALYVLFLDLGRWFGPKGAGEKKPVILFDGVCALCDSFVTSILSWDRMGIFQVAPLQGETARKIAGPQSPDPSSWSIVLADEDGVFHRSDAALKIVSRLGGLWKFTEVLLWIPRNIRDWVYDFIANRRYQWFGKRESCRIPKAGEKERFLP